MNLRILHDKLSTNLGLIKNKIDLENTSNNQSLNVIVETPFLEILNAIYNYSLKNTNLLKSNFTAVDGYDEENGVVVQITSTFSLDKIRQTVEKLINDQENAGIKKLFFLFLKPKKSIRKESQQEILRLINGNFHFDFKESILDINDIYRLLVNSTDFNKALHVNKILESVLFDICVNSNSNLEYIGLSFTEEDVEKAIVLAKVLIKLSFNVVLDSKSLYNKFIEKGFVNTDYLIYLEEQSKLDFLKNVVVIISSDHIKSSIDSPQPKCRIFKYSKSKGMRPLLLSFNDFTDDIEDKQFKNPRTVNIDNLKKIEELILNYLKPKTAFKYSFQDIKQVLKSLFPTHTLVPVVEDKNFCIYNFNYKNSVINFLIFNYDYRRADVLRIFESEYKKKYSENLIMLIPKDYNQTTSNRLRFLKDKYPSPRTEVNFIDEYLFENSLNAISQESLLLNDVFIPPFFKIGEDVEKLDDVFDWLKNDDTTVAFIIGSGGDGKTTVCQKIHDEIINNFDNNIVIFLDAQSYIGEIQQRERIDNSKFDLQTVFEISNGQVGGIDINTFKSNFAFGNITVIIDGIDEIISTLPNFNLSDFLDDFNKLEETIGKGKLIINCRDIYIDELMNNDEDFEKKYKVYNLQKFTKELVEKYFTKHFRNDAKKVKDSIKLLDEFYDDINGKTFIYSPFVLEIIATIVENDFDYEIIEYYFDSKILLKENTSDYLIYKICKREIAKKENHGFIIEVDDYIRLLGLIAIEKNGIFSDDDFALLLRKLNIDLNSDKVKSSLKDNPFFYFEKNKYHFRFDFYNSVFKYNAIYSKIIEPASFELTDAFITVLSKELKPNSVLLEGLKNKLLESNFNFEILLTKIKGLINEIKYFWNNNHKSNSGYEFVEQLAISNLLVLLCEIDTNKKPENIIKNIFSEESLRVDDIVPITGLYLINISENDNLRINFSNMYFSDTIIENYPDFLNCTFNENTFFDHTCTISKISNQSFDFKTCSAKKINFDDHIISGDNTLYKAIMLTETGGESILKYLRKYLRTFQKGNKIIEKVKVTDLPKSDTVGLSLTELNNILLNHQILVNISKEDVEINRKLKNKLVNFITQNMTFLELNKVMRAIEKKELEE